MAPRKKTLAGTWRGLKPETLAAITWHPANRAQYEASYPDRPRFTAAELPKPGKNSFQALVGRQVVGPDLVIRTAVHFVAYTKDHGSIEIVSICFAILDALAWIEGGMPDSKVGYGPHAPQLMPEQLGELAPAPYVPVPRVRIRSASRRTSQVGQPPSFLSALCSTLAGG